MSDYQWRDTRPTLPEGYQFGDAKHGPKPTWGHVRAINEQWLRTYVDRAPPSISANAAKQDTAIMLTLYGHQPTEPLRLEPDDDHLWGV